jgi:hypothetical protein
MFKVGRGWVIAVGLLGAGFLTLATGVVYDLMFAGIPYQDPSPELQARYRFHSRVAGVLLGTGLILAVVGSAGATLLAGRALLGRRITSRTRW